MPGDPSRSIRNANHRALVMTLAERVARGMLSYGISSWVPSGAGVHPKDGIPVPLLSC